MRHLIRSVLTVLFLSAAAAGLGSCGGPAPPAPQQDQVVTPAVPGAPTGQPIGEVVPLEDVVTELNVQKALLEGLGVEGMRVDTQVEGNAVTLVGEVHDPETLTAAEEIVDNLEGVELARNELTVTPVALPDDVAEGTSEELELDVNDAILEVEVRLSLLGAIGLVAQQIEVESTNGTVMLGGWLPSEDLKTEAVAAVEGLEGVADVINGIQVTQPVVNEYEG